MERQKSSLLIFIWILFGFLKIAVAQDTGCNFLKFYLEGNMQAWEQEVDNMVKQDHTSMPENKLYELALAEYGLIGYLLGKEEDDKAEKYIDRAADHIGRLIKMAPQNAAYLSLKAAFIAFEIPLAPYKAIYKGPESMALIEQAVDLNKDEPAARIEMGNALYHMPRVFGGSIEEAINNYKMAIQLFEKQGKTKCNWLYPHTMAILGTFYLETGDWKNARVQFEKCLRLFPGFKWVEEELMEKVK